MPSFFRCTPVLLYSCVLVLLFSGSPGNRRHRGGHVTSLLQFLAKQQHHSKISIDDSTSTLTRDMLNTLWDNALSSNQMTSSSCVEGESCPSFVPFDLNTFVRWWERWTDPVDFFFPGNLLLNKIFSGIADASEEFSKEVFMFFNEKIASFPIERSTETWVKMFGTYVTSVCFGW